MLLTRDDPFEVLMVRRNATGTFASSLVFPGGAIEQSDASEEWSPLVGAMTDAPPAGTLTGLDFREFIEGSGIRLRLDTIVPFGHWVTPVIVPRRFDTRFYLARAPERQVAVADGSETVGIEWVGPAAAVRAAKSGEWPIIFPTLMNLDRLSESAETDAALAAARVRPPFTVQPVMELLADGSQVISIPVEAGYSVTRFTA